MDPLVELFDYPQTIWRGERWKLEGGQPGGKLIDLGEHVFHLVFPCGKSFQSKSFLIQKDKPSPNKIQNKVPGNDFNIQSDCYTRKTISGKEVLEANPSGPQTCLTHDTRAQSDSAAMVFRPPGEPHLLYKVRGGGGIPLQGHNVLPNKTIQGEAVIYSCSTGQRLGSATIRLQFIWFCSNV